MTSLSLLTDFYELTMMQGFWESGMAGRQAVFEMTFRNNPCGHGYSRHTDARPCAKCGGGLEYEIGRARRDGIVKVALETLRIIIETRQPLGLFYALENLSYTGVDNHDGNAWTESFSNMYLCKRWLLDQTKTTGGCAE